MKPTADYFTAAIPEPWQILGLRLRPFSLGHYRILSRFKCAFVCDTAEAATNEDVVFGVLVCSMKPKEFLAMIDSDECVETIKKWGEKCGLFDLPEKAKLFKDYLEAHSTVPHYWEEKSGTPSGAHWSQCVEVCLRSELGWTEDEIDNQPLSKAFADYFKHAETNGAIRLMTAQEIELTTPQEELCPA